MLTSAQSDLAPRGNQRRPLSAPLAGWVCGCANGSVKFPAYCRRVRFRVGWCRTITVGPCTGQRVNSAEKREIVDIVVVEAIDCRIGTGVSLMMGHGGWRLVPRRRRDADDVPRYQRAHTPLDSISAFCLTRPGLKAFTSSHVYYTQLLWCLLLTMVCIFYCFCNSSLQKFLFFTLRCIKTRKSFFSLICDFISSWSLGV